MKYNQRLVKVFIAVIKLISLWLLLIPTARASLFIEHKIIDVVTPDYYHIIISNIKDYDFEYEDLRVSQSELANLDYCLASSKCLVEAQEGGAYYFGVKQNGAGQEYYVYYDYNGRIVGFADKASVDASGSTSVSDSLQHNAVGSIPGEFSVSPSGASTYSIPVELPPGISGMAPQLSLDYSSQAGSGLLGMGWSMNGLSSITRCPTSKAQDGFIDTVDFDGNDRYCLDGQRLVSVSGAYGANGTEYRTEVDSYARIVSYGQQGNGPQYFVVWTKSGQVVKYGATADSRLEAAGQSSVFVWSANRVMDSVGNYFDVVYQKYPESSEIYPLYIDYTKGNISGRAANVVFFEYEVRPDSVPGFVGNSLVQQTRRLKSITSYERDNIVTKYAFEYTSQGFDNRSLLQKIWRCSGGSKCVSPTVINWDARNISISSGSGPDHYVKSGSVEDLSRIKYGDFNGDGRTDVLQLSGFFSTILYSSGSGFVSQTGPYVPIFDETDAGRVHVADFSGDGRDDILYLKGSSSADTTILISSDIAQNGFSSVSGPNLYVNQGSRDKDLKRIKLGDFNGDGRMDILRLNGNGNSGTTVYYSAIQNENSAPFNSQTGPALYVGSTKKDLSRVFLGDFNGDGMTDILRLDGAGSSDTTIHYAKSGGFYTRSGPPIYVDGGAFHYSMAAVKLGDFNGDRKIDIFYPSRMKNAYVHILYSKGEEFQSHMDWGTKVDAENLIDLQRIKLGDFNGDGRTDILNLLGNGSSQSVFYYSSSKDGSQVNWATKFSAQSGPSIYVSGGDNKGFDLARVKFGDFNGNGSLDIHRLNGNNSSSTTIHSTSGQPLDLLTEIDTGSGQTTTIAYAPMSDPNVYSLGGAALGDHINRPMKAGPYLVSGYQSSNGIGSTNSYSYEYELARVNTAGRGFLGFQKVYQTDNQTGIVNTTIYSQAFPKTGQVETAFTELSDGQTLSWASNDSVFVQSGNVYRLASASSNELAYTLQGAVKSTVYTEKENYDAYGNVGKVTVTTTAGGETFTKVTDNQYYNDTANWYLGRLTRSVVTSTSPAGTESRVSEFEYSSATGLLTAEIIEPNDPDLMQRTEYTYDTFGNKNSVTVSGSSAAQYTIATRTSTTHYDYGALASQGTYRVTSTNALGHSETKIVDGANGKVLSLTGPNGLQTQWYYDDFGRKTKEYRADGTSTSWQYAGCASGCPANAAYKVTTTTTGSAPKIVYHDNLNREIRTQTVGLGGETILKDTVYNALGEVWKVSRPYFAYDIPVWTEYTYDVLGRVKQEVSPDGGVVETTYNGLSTTLRRHSGNSAYGYDQTVTRVKNGQGELVRVVDEGGSTTTYDYDPFGNLIRLTDAQNNVTTMSYDRRGHKIAMNDPDMGYWQYGYDALGQLRWQKDAKGQIVTMDYDSLGRMTSRTEAEGTTTWIYDTAPGKGIGKLHEILAADGYSEARSYDSLGRPAQTVRTVAAGIDLSSQTAYDAYGRVHTRTSPSGFALEHVYTANGYLEQVRAANDPSLVYWRADAAGPDGQITMETLGNGLVTTRVFDIYSGRLQNLNTGFLSMSEVQDLDYSFDALGNLRSRQDQRQNITEEFGYDNYNRLTDATVVGYGTRSYQYDTLGNIEAKSGVTDYQYGSANSAGVSTDAGPHAVTFADGNAYQYDDNGNMVSGAGRTLQWSSYNKPVEITRGDTTLTFDYAPSRARYKQVKTTNGVTTTTYYSGKGYERVVKNGVVTHKDYLSAGKRTVAIREAVEGGGVTTKYLHQDHLGSTDAITDENGQVLERLSFTAFGSRRAANDWQAAMGLTSAQTTRGYTGHEQLDEVGLVHMNGRVYDPELGRFLSADPNVQAPLNPQNLNRYSYVNNNPLSYTDPSGFFFKKLFKSIKKLFNKVMDSAIGRAVVGIALGFVAYAYVGLLTNPLIGKMAGGFVGGYVSSGGSVKAGLIGAVTGAAFHGVGKLANANSWGPLERVAAHGVVGGASSRLSGGKFKHGFLSAGFAKLSSPFVEQAFESTEARVAASAVAGGVGAELGGGKFANGATTASFSYLFASAASGQGGSFGDAVRGFGRGVAKFAKVLAVDVQALVVGQVGAVTTFFGDLASVGTNLFNFDLACVGRAVYKTVYDAIIPNYGYYGGAGWGLDQHPNGVPAPLNSQDWANFQHDDHMLSLQWVRDSWSGSSAYLPTGPIGQAYKILGTVPFAVHGAVVQQGAVLP